MVGLVASNRDPLSSAPVVFKGRALTSGDLGLIRQVVEDCGLSRQELAATVCELLDLRRARGGLKVVECKELLARLEARGFFTLPPLTVTKPRGTPTSVPTTARGEPQEPFVGTVADVAPVVLTRVVASGQRLLWRELVSRYHYLGHTVPFGAHLRYLVEVSHPSPVVVGCVQLSSPAWKMAPRDCWIGWSDEVRRRNLQRIVNNSRFLILPWVRVRNLASAVLAQMARQLPEDWEQAYGVRPLLLETLVDQRRFHGTCYLAANWVRLGVTQGRGRMDRAHTLEGARPTTIFVYPLHRRARALLCQVEKT